MEKANRQVIKLSVDLVGEIERFKYLKTFLQKNGDFEDNTKHRIKSEWIKRKKGQDFV